MRKMLLLTLGGAVGFVLGARAGRPTYDRLVQRWSDMAGSTGITELASTVKEAGVDVRDTAVSRASAAVSTSADEVTDRIDRTTMSSLDDDAVVTSVGPESGGY